MIWNEQQLLKSCEQWRGTPHRDRLRLKSRGVDCINFVAAVAIENGIVESFTIPFYQASWGIGRKNNIMERLMMECFNVQKVANAERADLRNGDVLIFRVGQQSNHVGIVCQDQCWHCMVNRTVEPCTLDASLLIDIQSVLRFTEKGFKKRPEMLAFEDFQEKI